MTADEEVALPGGNVGGAVRVGDTVRRPTVPGRRRCTSCWTSLRRRASRRSPGRSAWTSATARSSRSCPGMCWRSARSSRHRSRRGRRCAGCGPSTSRSLDSLARAAGGGSSSARWNRARSCATTTPRSTTWCSTVTSWRVSSTGTSPVRASRWTTSRCTPGTRRCSSPTPTRARWPTGCGRSPTGTATWTPTRCWTTCRCGSRRPRTASPPVSAPATRGCCGSGAIGEPASTLARLAVLTARSGRAARSAGGAALRLVTLAGAHRPPRAPASCPRTAGSLSMRLRAA